MDNRKSEIEMAAAVSGYFSRGSARLLSSHWLSIVSFCIPFTICQLYGEDSYGYPNYAKDLDKSTLDHFVDNKIWDNAETGFGSAYEMKLTEAPADTPEGSYTDYKRYEIDDDYT